MPTAWAIFVADAHRDDGKRFVVRADEILTAFVEPKKEREHRRLSARAPSDMKQFLIH